MSTFQSHDIAVHNMGYSKAARNFVFPKLLLWPDCLNYFSVALSHPLLHKCALREACRKLCAKYQHTQIKPKWLVEESYVHVSG